MITIRQLTNTDINSVKLFIEEQLNTIPKAFFFPPNLKIIEKSLNTDTGISLGAFDDNELIGIRLTYKPGLDKENHGYDLGYSDEQLGYVAQFHGTLVRDERRYHGIGSQLVHEDCEIIFKQNFKIILATVHPENFNSIRMLLKNDFIEKKLVIKYNNLPRLIFEKHQSKKSLL